MKLKKNTLFSHLIIIVFTEIHSFHKMPRNRTEQPDHRKTLITLTYKLKYTHACTHTYIHTIHNIIIITITSTHFDNVNLYKHCLEFNLYIVIHPYHRTPLSRMEPLGQMRWCWFESRHRHLVPRCLPVEIITYGDD